MSGLSARRRGRVGGGQTNLTADSGTARGPFSSRSAQRPHTATTVMTTRSHSPPMYGRRPDGTYVSSKGILTPLDKFSPLSARTKMGLMASLHSEKGILQPIWPRVSTTPYYPRHCVIHGNGRDMHSSGVSFEAPDFFHIPQVMGHKYHPSKGSFTDVRTPQDGTLAVGSTAESPDLPAYLTVPGISDFWKGYNRRKGNPYHRLIFFHKQAMFEPTIKGGDGGGIRAAIFGPREGVREAVTAGGREEQQ